ncbi:MAG: FAD-binding protein [Victivallales bacterium]|nr:FAD-binding protein [Victivallales bacterium]
MPEYNQLTDSIAQELIGIFGAANVYYNDAERLEPYAHDEAAGCATRIPEAVVRPKSAEEISQLLKLANREKIPVTARGAGSGLSGGAVPIHGGIVIDCCRMNHILDVDKANMTVTVEPGVITSEINEMLRPHGLFYAGYPMSLETCTIGGNVAENAGGGKAVKYGVTGRYVLGIEMVSPTGDIVMLGGKLVKDVSGLNLLQLMIGSEGILGVFTKIILKLLPLPKASVDMLCLFNSIGEAIGAVPKIMTEGGVIPTAMEFMDKLSFQTACKYLNETLPCQDSGAMLLITIDGADAAQVEHDYDVIGEQCLKAGATQVYVADTKANSERIWRIRRSVDRNEQHGTRIPTRQRFVKILTCSLEGQFVHEFHSGRDDTAFRHDFRHGSDGLADGIEQAEHIDRGFWQRQQLQNDFREDAKNAF